MQSLDIALQLGLRQYLQSEFFQRQQVLVFSGVLQSVHVQALAQLYKLTGQQEVTGLSLALRIEPQRVLRDGSVAQPLLLCLGQALAELRQADAVKFVFSLNIAVGKQSGKGDRVGKLVDQH